LIVTAAGPDRPTQNSVTRGGQEWPPYRGWVERREKLSLGQLIVTAAGPVRPTQNSETRSGQEWPPYRGWVERREKLSLGLSIMTAAGPDRPTYTTKAIQKRVAARNGRPTAFN